MFHVGHWGRSPETAGADRRTVSAGRLERAAGIEPACTSLEGCCFPNQPDPRMSPPEVLRRAFRTYPGRMLDPENPPRSACMQGRRRQFSPTWPRLPTEAKGNHLFLYYDQIHIARFGRRGNHLFALPEISLQPASRL